MGCFPDQVKHGTQLDEDVFSVEGLCGVSLSAAQRLTAKGFPKAPPCQSSIHYGMGGESTLEPVIRGSNDRPVLNSQTSARVIKSP